ncbi:DUF4167 domain-containing protein [Novosphingobium album (ex Liu et al. 2023)]|uniref:DUF4167 domain-containing protein n=1 Tax=Novosphingobium album (ex Liu et al. 2023) TaxID=3031130 RepID=A0ABT5WTE1_9SPHN|nr:DUF4167 domain-containing protein [Novosphingobium album (ex Liu et al. 2023)]MDE8653037.1 DUF4167 domain-containing protein [Novosphingobium album (ex Liu et al. 2023)]
MNNNRGNNNRRRGRGNNRQQGNQQTNRIDSRARGNAPQLLEKYRKLAHDAHLNGDRVTEEYYLQFADHYFRVMADQRQRLDETRPPRRDDRMSDYGDDYGNDDDEMERSADRGGPAASRDNGPYGESSRGEGNRSENGRSENGRGENGRSENSRGENSRGDSRGEGDRIEASDERAAGNDGVPAGEGERSVYEPTENPFVRDSRAARGTAKPRKPRRPAQNAEAQNTGENRTEDQQADTGERPNVTAGLDPATLPPSISAQGEKAATKDEGEEKPAKPRRRTRRTAPPSDDAGEALEAVN